MASKYSQEYSDRYVEVPHSKPRRVSNDEIKCVYAKYDLGDDAAAIGTGDTVYLCKIPAGARVVEARLAFDDLGTTGSLNVGWAADSAAVETADSDGFFSVVDVTTAADQLYSSIQQAQSPGLGKVFAAEVDVVLTAPAATSATDGNIEFFLYYV